MTHNQFVTPEQLAKVRLPLEEAYNLPQAAYVSENIFRQEAGQLFLKHWVNVAHVSQISEPGDYLCLDVFDTTPGLALFTTRGDYAAWLVRNGRVPRNGTC